MTPKTPRTPRISIPISDETRAALAVAAAEVGATSAALAAQLVAASMGLRPFPPGYPVKQIRTPVQE